MEKAKELRNMQCVELGNCMIELSVRKCENIFSLRNVDCIAK